MEPEEFKKQLKQAIKEHRLEDNDAVDILKILSNSISNSDTSDALIRSIVNEVLSDYKNQMKVFIVAYTKSKISRTTKLFELLNKVEDKIYDKIAGQNIEEADLRLLLTLRGSLSGSLEEIIQLANTTKNLDLDPVITQNIITNITQYNQTNVENALIDIGDKDRRMDLRHGISDILRKIEESNTNDK